MRGETFGRRLKRLREEAGLSQAQLAAAADVPIGTLRGAEYDRREPLIGTATKLARALGVTLDELAGEAVREKPGASPNDLQPPKIAWRKAAGGAGTAEGGPEKPKGRKHRG